MPDTPPRKEADRAIWQLITAARSRSKWTLQADYENAEDFAQNVPCGYDVIEVDSGCVKLRVDIAEDGRVSFDNPSKSDA